MAALARGFLGGRSHAALQRHCDRDRYIGEAGAQRILWLFAPSRAPSKLRPYRHLLPRRPIGRSRSPKQDDARLHFACTLTLYQQPSVKESDAGAGASSPARWLRCGGAAGRCRPCAHRVRKPGADREHSASTQSMQMQKRKTVHASDEMKRVRRRLRQSYGARGQKGIKRVSGSKR
eukprot:1406814-Pleurochrysis_carterae.AAC.8